MVPRARARSRAPLAAVACLVTLVSGCNDDPAPGLESSSADSSGADGSGEPSGTGGSSGASTSGASVDASSSGGQLATSTGSSSADATSMMAESSSTGTPLMLPTPCDEVASVYVDEPAHEPNDTPEEATDMCTIDVVGSWHVIAEIGGDDLLDHFVFHTAGDTGVVPLLLDACFEVALDLQLFQFADGELVFLWSGQSTLPDCETIPPALPAGDDYLLVVSVPAGARLAPGTAYSW